MSKEEVKMASYKVSYRPVDGLRIKYKTVKAKSSRAALVIFKKLTGIKGIVAKYVPTKAERELAARRRTHTKGRKMYFDGRTMCYMDNDCVVGMENGYTH